ncbi:peptidylprolyl isomerase [Enterococcus silesiacus]|uniref:Peptidyl-prolyl cis-trans isomerase n=1 Tax=Enterococcus silesiacus TaxID=332949 RepID=A0A0S3K8H1_9ENTE|nr:peptidylprolyl isomerase [Enterococcus silesiacus]ALS00591.1 peptidylprolyl isomerase [Enterococcus silesiacus]OJG86979.1 peptidyl-prolyl cis-trans isomerase, cyclophilin-type [Enterococcus silesiacus]
MKTKKFIAATALLATLVLFAACGPNKEKAADSSATSSTETKSSESVDLNSLELPQLSDTVNEDEDLVEMVTTEGTIEIKLFPKQAPKTVENFMTHAKDGYYDNVLFHRVIENFMIQGGDPKGDGTGGESIWNGSFDDEISNQLYNIRGALSMANAGKDEKGNGTNGSQFFIVQNTDDMSDGLLKDDYPEKIIDAYKKGGTPHLDGKHTVFGQVTKGMDVVDKIASAETADQDKPKKDIRIEKINILQEAKK